MYRISHPDGILEGTVQLESSKSISNRVLLIRALSGLDFNITGLSKAQDTQTLMTILSAESKPGNYNVGPAGTTFRFLTAYFSLQPGVQTLTGSERMLKRPIGPLVEALEKIGADIDYVGEHGFPPLRIKPPIKNKSAVISIDAGISSQFISALLMVGPMLQEGLELQLQGNVVSRSYIVMTLNLMNEFGVRHEWSDDTISIKPQKYQAKSFSVEKDWSGASYFYSMAALAENARLMLPGLQEKSLQGDSVISRMIKIFGVDEIFDRDGVVLRSGGDKKSVFEWDFLMCPDLGQTMVVLCAATGTTGLFTGLETLAIKETDRTLALRNELKKAGSIFVKLPSKFHSRTEKAHYLLEGKFEMPESYFINTYEDHRMAMSFAPLALIGTVEIEDPDVVVKSFPGFWDEMSNLGFHIEQI